MKLDIEVLASTNIKRKKPWPKIAWLGEERESLFLLDRNRLSVLYVPSGKTTRKIPKLSPLLPTVVSLSTTNNGHFLVCLLASGDVAVWHKDRDMLKTIPGLPDHLTSTDLSKAKTVVLLSDDCGRLLVVIDNKVAYVWEKDPRQYVFTAREDALLGAWSTVVSPHDISLPGPTSREATVTAVFYSHKVLGSCCQCSVVFNKDDKLCVTTSLLRFSEPAHNYSQRSPSFSTEWSSIQYPIRSINSQCAPISCWGAYVARYSHDGQVLALAVNQKSPKLTTLLYISPLTDTVVIADLKCCGTDPAIDKMGRSYWIADLEWTMDDLLVVCVTRHGSLCVTPRLGEPLPLQSSGCSMDMGPSYFLPLHPLIFVRHNNLGTSQDGRESADSMTEHDTMKQHFSVATHPRLPIILCSDGYLVTVLQMPPELSCLSAVRTLVLESTNHLSQIVQQENLQLTLADAYKMPSSKRGEKVGTKGYNFEKPSSALMSSLVSEESFGGSQEFLGDMASGKIIFGGAEALASTLEGSYSKLESSEAILKHVEKSQSALFTAWGLIVSHGNDWSPDLETITKHCLKNITKLFSILLDCGAVEEILSELVTLSVSAVENVRLFKLLNLYKAILHLLQFDTLKQCLLPSVLRFTHATLELVLNSDGLSQSDPRLKTLAGCLTLLKFTESTVDKVYVWVSQSIQPSDEYEPAYMSEVTRAGIVTGQRSSEPGSRVTNDEHRMTELHHRGKLPSKRLSATWKVLYKHLAHHQDFLSNKQKKGREWSQVKQLVSAVQQKLQDLDSELPQKTPHRASAGDKLSLNGLYTQALDAWKEQLKSFASESENKKTSKLLHAVLYTHILRGELGQAVDFVDNMLTQTSLTTGSELDGSATLQDQKSLLLTLVSSTLRNQGDSQHDMVPCIRNKAIRKLVQTMARFMAAYFANETVYIFPPHNPRCLPPVHVGKPVTNGRILPRYHKEITELVSRAGLQDVWSTNRTLEYLMLSGLVWEGAWFADKMGDWKAAFLLSVACVQHRKVAPHLYESPKPHMQLPEPYLPASILEKILAGMIDPPTVKDEARARSRTKYDVLPIDDETDLSQMTKTLEDILKAGIMCNVDIAPWLLRGLVDRLKGVTEKFHPLVPQEFYLPAPPLYCPQPAQTSQDALSSAEGEEEQKLRFEASSLTQLILVILNSSHLSLPLLRWYIKDLTIAQARAAQFKATTEGPSEELPDVLGQHYSMPSVLLTKLQYTSVQAVLMSFRDFCSIQWLMHARDKLSIMLRKREKYLSNLNYEDYLKSNWSSSQEDAWMKECFTSLLWAVNMLAFSQFLSDEGSVYKVLLSLLIELPPSEDTADILAEHLFDSENLDAEVQEKLAILLKRWQAIIVEPEDDGKSVRNSAELTTRNSAELMTRNSAEITSDGKDVKKSVTFLQASPRGKTLSVYFEKQCQVVVKLLKKKKKCFGKYEPFVFDKKEEASENRENEIDLFIGCRPFETKQSYMEFLDTLFAVCFSKLVDAETESNQSVYPYPLLEPFAREIKKKELQSLAFKVVNSIQQRQSVTVLSASRSRTNDSYRETGSRVSNVKSQGLFRSRSVVDVSSGSVASPRVKRYLSEGGGLDAIPEVSDRVERSPSKSNMTDLASKFWRSEEALYRESAAELNHNLVSLDIDFGQKYADLQNLMEWLSRWANKHHSLALGDSDCLRPKMRIAIPPQLVVLALWLVEHKYSDRPGQQESQDASREDQQNSKGTLQTCVEQLGSSPSMLKRREESLNVNMSVPQLEEVVERQTSPTQAQKIRARMRKHLKFSNVSQMGTNYGGENEDEDAEIQNAYAEVLEGNEESESLEVSSLASEEMNEDLRLSLSIVRSGGSPTRGDNFLNTTFTKTGGSTGETSEKVLATVVNRNTRSQHRSRSPDNASRRSGGLRRSPSPNHSSIGARLESDSKLSVRDLRNPESSRASSNSRSHRKVSEVKRKKRYSHKARNTENQPPEGAGGSQDLANQLQRIVRGELRRMMEVQHKSMMMMMGALDETVTPEVMSRHHSPSHGSPGRSLSPEHLGQGTMGSEELGMSGSRSRSKGRPHVKRALQELKNLQERDLVSNAQSVLRMSALQGSKEDNQKIAPPEENHVYFSGQTGAPRFLRIPAERDMSDVKLPHIPLQSPRGRDGTPITPDSHHMPLLRPDDRGSHAGISHSSKPLIHLPGPGFFQPRQPANLFSLPAHLPPNQVYQDQQHQRSGTIGIPLLRLPAEHRPLLSGNEQLTFGHLIPPHLVLGNEQLSHIDEVRQKHAQDFEQQQQEQLSQRERERFKQLLKVDLRRGGQPSEKPDTDKRRFRRQQKSVPGTTETATESDDIDKDNVSSSPPVVSPDKVRSPKRKPVMPRQEENVASEPENGEDGKLHDGYAIRPGLFEGYLNLEEELGGDHRNNNAKFQYEAAKAMQDQLRQEKKVNFTTMTKEEADLEMRTELVRSRQMRDAATAISKDTGTDPIQEALIEYNRARQGAVLAPDIYLGLRFGDTEGQSTTATAPMVSEPSRGFLNVVDIRASAVLRELSERREGEREELLIQPDLSLKPTAMRTSQERSLRPEMELLEDAAREEMKPRPRQTGDSLTLRMFQRSHVGDDSFTAAVFPGPGSRERSRSSVIRQLRTMGEQIEAIEQMSNTMEHDYNNTRLLLNTIESLGEAVDPDHDGVTPRSSGGKVSPTARQPTPKDETSRSSLTPVPSEKSPQRSVRSQGQASIRLHGPTHSSAEKAARHSGMDVKMSGLSGISDIIGEMLEKGGIDFTEAGLSPEEARQLTRSAANSRRANESVKMSMDKLKQIVSDAGPNANKRDPEEQRALQDWMSERRRRQVEEHRQRREQLRETERHPFHPIDNVDEDHPGSKELASAERQRDESRKTLAKENMEKRFMQATQLLDDIMTDRPPVVEEQLKTSPKPSPKSARFSSRIQTNVISPRGASAGRPKTAPSQARKTSPPGGTVPRKTFKISEIPISHDEQLIRPVPRLFPDDLRNIRPMPKQFDDRPIRPMPRQTYNDDDRPIRPVPPRQFLPEQELGHSGGTTGRAAEYAMMVDSLDTITEATTPGRTTKDDDYDYSEPDEESVIEPYRPKPYTQIVRVQRPEITRKQTESRPFGQTYVERRGSPTTPREDSTEHKPIQTRSSLQDDKEKLYGSKHIPRASRASSTSPRRVKTYTERLQEMKRSRKVYSTPIVPRQQPPRSVRQAGSRSQIPVRASKWKGPLHKPLTYTEQLQQLSNRGQSTARPQGRGVYVRPQVGIKARGPPHKPKTYVQQLQHLNEQAPRTARSLQSSRGAESMKYQLPADRGQTRARPYADPYTLAEDVVQEEEGVDSDLSGWEVDERVRKLLYEDDGSSYGAAGGTTMDYEPSEGISDYYDVIMSKEYADSVDVRDIHKIADTASVSSGSIMSYIDWDAVDQLIYEP